MRLVEGASHSHDLDETTVPGPGY